MAAPWIFPAVALFAIFALANSGAPLPRDAIKSPPPPTGGGDIEDLPVDLQGPVSDFLASCTLSSRTQEQTNAAQALATLLRSKGFTVVAARIQACLDGPDLTPLGNPTPDPGRSPPDPGLTPIDDTGTDSRLLPTPGRPTPVGVAPAAPGMEPIFPPDTGP